MRACITNTDYEWYPFLSAGRISMTAGKRSLNKANADFSIYGQESNYTTWRLAKMNLAIRGIDGQIAHGIR